MNKLKENLEVNKQQVHLVIGPDINLNIDAIQKAYAETGHTIEIHGDGKLPVDIHKIDFSEGSNIIINAHGNMRNDLHIMQLKEIDKAMQLKDLDNTYDTKFILSGIKTATNVEVRSCLADVAHHINHLPIGSSLMSFVSSKHICAGRIEFEHMIQIAKFEYINNIFIKFLFNILINPEDNSFAMHLNANYRPIFTSKLGSLKDYSVPGIRAWHEKEVDRFIQFTKEINLYTNAKHSKQIHQFEELFSNNEDIKNFILKYNTERYQELLFLNAATGNIEIVRSMALKVNINSVYQDGNTALYYSALFGKIDVVRFLVESGINSNNELLVAAQEEYFEIVKCLVRNGYNIETSIKGHTPLFQASLNGHFEIVKFLIAKKANIEAITDQGASSLIAASDAGYFEIVKFLIAKKANIDIATPLYLAAMKGHFEIVKFLVESGAKIEALGENGITSLWIAAQNGHLRIVKFLVENGANKEALGLNGVTALWMAAQNSHIETIEFLVKNGAKIDASTIDGVTALWVAAQNGRLKIVQFLVKNGANKEALGFYEGPALCIAAYNGYIKIVKFLLENGATNVKEEFIKHFSNFEIIKILKEYTIDPIKYILSASNNNESKLKALKSLSKQTHSLSSSKQIEEEIAKIELEESINLVIVEENHNNVEPKLTTTKIQTVKIESTYSLGFIDFEESSNLITSNKAYLPTLDDSSKTSISLTTDQLFNIGFYSGNFIVSPVIKYINDGVNGKNLEKSIFDYYSDKFSLLALTKSAVFSLVLYNLPNSLNMPNKLLFAKILSDASVNEVYFSSEYASSLLRYLATSLTYSSVIEMGEQSDYYQDHPFAMGIVVSTIGDITKLSYDALDHVYHDFMN